MNVGKGLAGRTGKVLKVGGEGEERIGGKVTRIRTSLYEIVSEDVFKILFKISHLSMVNFTLFTQFNKSIFFFHFLNFLFY